MRLGAGIPNAHNSKFYVIDRIIDLVLFTKRIKFSVVLSFSVPMIVLVPVAPLAASGFMPQLVGLQKPYCLVFLADK